MRFLLSADVPPPVCTLPLLSCLGRCADIFSSSRMFEMAKDSILEGDKYEILGGYYSPV